MGRIKTKLIKRKTKELMGIYGDSFTDNFEENKKITSSKVKVNSKKLRNIIAGYVTRLKKQKK